MSELNKRSVAGWVALGCGLALAGLVAFVVVIAIVVIGSMRSSTPYKEAVARAQHDARVTQVLGTPIEPGLWTGGNINIQNESGNADINIPISGPRGKASIHVVATKEGGRWSYSRMVVTPEQGEVIDLLAQPGSRGTAPPAA
jgi:hypothetical protein